MILFDKFSFYDFTPVVESWGSTPVVESLVESWGFARG